MPQSESKEPADTAQDSAKNLYEEETVAQTNAPTNIPLADSPTRSSDPPLVTAHTPNPPIHTKKVLVFMDGYNYNMASNRRNNEFHDLFPSLPPDDLLVEGTMTQCVHSNHSAFLSLIILLFKTMHVRGKRKCYYREESIYPLTPWHSIQKSSGLIL
jgi:hypothetical protein